MLLKETAILSLLSLAKIPSVLFLAPRVIELDDEGCAIRIPLTWRTRNHVGAMYMGALCAGADVAAGLNAAWLTVRRSRRWPLRNCRSSLPESARPGSTVRPGRSGARSRIRTRPSARPSCRSDIRLRWPTDPRTA